MHLFNQSRWFQWWRGSGQLLDVPTILIPQCLQPIELLQDRHALLTEGTLAIEEYGCLTMGCGGHDDILHARGSRSQPSAGNALPASLWQAAIVRVLLLVSTEVLGTLHRCQPEAGLQCVPSRSLGTRCYFLSTPGSGNSVDGTCSCSMILTRRASTSGFCSATSVVSLSSLPR